MATMSNPPTNLQHDQASSVRPVCPVGSAVLDTNVQVHLGRELRAWYGNPAEEKLPSDLAQLLRQLSQVIRARTESVNQAFVDGIVARIPSLRKFAISLTRNADLGEDLVQETVLRAISKQEQFMPGTNLQAWLFTILRNQFFSDHRKSFREVEDVDGSYAATMIFIPDQEDKVMIQDVAAALSKLPEGQREAILLVSAEGLSYEEAAQALGCAVGTVKSRVNRARNCLAELMRLAGEDGITRSYPPRCGPAGERSL